MLYKLIAGRDTVSPAFANGIKAKPIGFRRVDAIQSYLGGVDLDGVGVNDAGMPDNRWGATAACGVPTRNNRFSISEIGRPRRPLTVDKLVNVLIRFAPGKR
jgi:hypothetical protein